MKVIVVGIVILIAIGCQTKASKMICLSPKQVFQLQTGEITFFEEKREPTMIEGIEFKTKPWEPAPSKDEVRKALRFLKSLKKRNVNLEDIDFIGRENTP